VQARSTNKLGVPLTLGVGFQQNRLKNSDCISSVSQSTINSQTMFWNWNVLMWNVAGGRAFGPFGMMCSEYTKI